MSATGISPAIPSEVRSRDTEIAVAVFRTILVLIVLFSPEFMEARGTRGALLVVAVIAASSYNLALFLLHVRGVPVPRLLIVVGDVMLVSIWLYFCGSGGERFFVLYYPVVIVAGLWFGVGGALLIAAFASALYLFVLTVAPGVTRASVESSGLQIAFLFVTAGVVSVVAEVRAREYHALLISQGVLQQHWQRIRNAQHVENMVRPSRLPRIPGIDVAFRFRPAATAESGDYYDLIPLGGRRWGACVADVRGKHSRGIAYVPTFKSALRFAARHEQSPAAVFHDVNSLVEAETAEKADRETFISLCYAVIDLDTASLTYANAGHEPPIIIPGSGGDPIALRGTGVVLGVLPEATYGEEELPLHTGDTLVLFSDGMIEAADRRNRMLGREGLIEQIRSHVEAPTADAMAGRIFDDVTEYGKGSLRRDDMTLLVLRVTATDLGRSRQGEDIGA